MLTQACLAISTLAVKRINDKVHNGNTRKLVTKVPSRPSSPPLRPRHSTPIATYISCFFASTGFQGAIEGVIAALQKYPQVPRARLLPHPQRPHRDPSLSSSF